MAVGKGREGAGTLRPLPDRTMPADRNIVNMPAQGMKPYVPGTTRCNARVSGKHSAAATASGALPAAAIRAAS